MQNNKHAQKLSMTTTQKQTHRHKTNTHNLYTRNTKQHNTLYTYINDNKHTITKHVTNIKQARQIQNKQIKHKTNHININNNTLSPRCFKKTQIKTQ